MDKLTKSDIDKRLKKLKRWSIKGQSLHKEYKFKDFKTAIRFINFLAIQAEVLNHHPDLTNSYDKVTIDITTHEVKGLTEVDFTLAERIDDSYDQLIFLGDERFLGL